MYARGKYKVEFSPDESLIGLSSRKTLFIFPTKISCEVITIKKKKKVMQQTVILYIYLRFFITVVGNEMIVKSLVLC